MNSENPDSKTDDGCCRRCGCEFRIRCGCEPTEYCDDCAQTLVEEFDARVILLMRLLVEAETTTYHRPDCPRTLWPTNPCACGYLSWRERVAAALTERPATDAADDADAGPITQQPPGLQVELLKLRRDVRQWVLSLTGELARARGSLASADRLAFEVGLTIQTRTCNARSRVADALLDYLCVGNPGGPETVPEWMEQYSRKVTKP